MEHTKNYTKVQRIQSEIFNKFSVVTLKKIQSLTSKSDCQESKIRSANNKICIKIRFSNFNRFSPITLVYKFKKKVVTGTFVHHFRCKM